MPGLEENITDITNSTTDGTTESQMDDITLVLTIIGVSLAVLLLMLCKNHLRQKLKPIRHVSEAENAEIKEGDVGEHKEDIEPPENGTGQKCLKFCKTLREVNLHYLLSTLIVDRYAWFRNASLRSSLFRNHEDQNNEQKSEENKETSALTITHSAVE